MSLNTDPDERTSTVADAFRVYVAREHWPPILAHALLYGTVLVGAAFLAGLAAPRLDEMGRGVAAASVR